MLKYPPETVLCSCNITPCGDFVLSEGGFSHVVSKSRIKSALTLFSCRLGSVTAPSLLYCSSAALVIPGGTRREKCTLPHLVLFFLLALHCTAPYFSDVPKVLSLDLLSGAVIDGRCYNFFSIAIGDKTQKNKGPSRVEEGVNEGEREREGGRE